MLYANPKYDKSDEILKNMGYNVNTSEDKPKKVYHH